MSSTMKEIEVELVFADWQQCGESVYDTDVGVSLSSGDFHHGSVFMGKLRLDEDQQQELLEALKINGRPVFVVYPTLKTILELKS